MFDKDYVRPTGAIVESSNGLGFEFGGEGNNRG